MMKRTLIAALMPLLLGLSTSHAAEIYNRDGNKLDLAGKINVSHMFSDDDNYDGDTSSYARLGFNGQTQISDELVGYGFWQYQYSLRNSEGKDANDGNRTRLGYAGLKFSDVGSVDYGRNFGLVYDVLSYTDLLPNFGGDSAYPDAFLAGRSTGVLTWRTNNFFGEVDGLSLAAQYQGKNERSGNSDSVRRSNGDGYALSTAYDTGMGIMFAGAFASLDRTDAQNMSRRGHGDRAQHWATSVKYDANSVYLAAMYGETLNATPIDGGFANKAQNVEMVAQYQFQNGVRPSIAYVSSKGKDIENIGDADILEYVSLGSFYYFNKNMSAFVDYRMNLMDDNNKLDMPTDDIVAIGLIYQF